MDLIVRCLALVVVAITLVSGCAHSLPDPGELRDTLGEPEPLGGFQASFSGDPVLLARIREALQPILERQKSDSSKCTQTTSWGLNGDPTVGVHAHGIAVLTFNCSEFGQKPKDVRFWAEEFGRLYAQIVVLGDSSNKRAALGDQSFVGNDRSAVSLRLSNTRACKQMECPAGRPGWYVPNSPLCKTC